VIEVDGDSHAEQVEYDESRTAWLEEHGYRVLRSPTKRCAITSTARSMLSGLLPFFGLIG
jgi:very-short-patch-repair endonuclease